LSACSASSHQETRHEVENPAISALREGVIVGLANHSLHHEHLGSAFRALADAFKDCGPLRSRLKRSKGNRHFLRISGALP
jgi:hypothetical protein